MCRFKSTEEASLVQSGAQPFYDVQSIVISAASLSSFKQFDKPSKLVSIQPASV